MKEPILPSLLDQRQAIRRELRQSSDAIIDRLTYIFKKIARVCDFEFFDWNVIGANEGEYGVIDLLFSNDKIRSYQVEFSELRGLHYDAVVPIILNGRTIDLKYSFPKRWMFENFENELVEGRRLYLQKIARKSMIRYKAKERAKSKLSAKEIKILGL